MPTIKNFDQVFKIAERGDAMRMTVISAGDAEVMLTVKEARERGFIEPILIGDEDKIKEASKGADFNLDGVKIVHEREPQVMAYASVEMAIRGDAEMQMKGRLPTSYLYRAVIRKRFRSLGVKKFNVIDFYELPSIDHFIAITDSGINITPDFETKLEIIQNTVSIFHLLGYPEPSVLPLSAARGVNPDLVSARDNRLLRTARREGRVDDCVIEDAFSLSDLFLGYRRYFDRGNLDLSKTPHIFLTPNLDAGNILAKLYHLFEGVRWPAHIIGGTKTPVLIPSRGDDHRMMINNIAFGVAIAHLMEEKR